MSRRAAAIVAAMVLAWAGVGGVIAWKGWSDDEATEPAEAASVEESSGDEPRPSPFALKPAADPLPVDLTFRKPPAAGILFDVDSGEVLWELNETFPLAPASLTKMMTALLIAEGHSFREKVEISPRAARARGSAVGILPQGKKVPLEPLLQALIMASANDAALALAEHHAGSVAAFIARMNARAAELGLDCSHFTTPSGLVDRGNRSCAADLAELARADLAQPRIARIARSRSASAAFPVEGGRLYLGNNHVFLHRGIRSVPGAKVTGLKTGLTEHAGRCYVTTARLGGVHLGVVLLDSPDPFRQVPRLLAAGFARNVPRAGVLPPPR